MITAIFNAIAALPSLVSSIESLVAWISTQLDQAKKRKAKEDFDKAADQAKQSKDTSGLDQAFDPNKKK